MLAAILAPGAAAKRPCAGAPGGGLTLANVAAGNGTVRAVGSNGLIARSRDLAHWRVEPTQVLHDLRGVVWTGRRWVVVGDVGTILYRQSGTWEAVPGLPGVGLRGIAARRGLVAASGSGGVVLTSPDGLSWTQSPSGTNSILWGGTRFGDSLLLSGQESTVIASGDGASWTPVSAFPFPTGNATAPRPFLWQMASHAGSVVAVGDFGAILEGVPGTGLNAVPSPTDEILRGVDANPRLWVVVGSAGTVLYSGDGRHWRRGTSPTTVDLRGVAWTGRRWVAVGDQSTAISSRDGKRWHLDVTAMPCALLGVAGGGGKIVAVGGGGNVQISADGRRWRRVRRPTGQDLYGLTRGPGRFVTVGAKGALLDSPDGRRWRARPSGTRFNLHTVTWTGGEYLAGGDRGRVLSSADGRSWRHEQFPGFHSVRAFATDGTSVIAAGAGTVALRPNPGAGWQLEDVGLGRFQTGIAYGNGRYVVVGHNGEILVSTDAGVSWTQESSGIEVNFDTVVWTGSQFLATGEGTAVTSSDGVGWQPVSLPSRRSVRALTVSGAEVVGVGDDNTHFAFTPSGGA